MADIDLSGKSNFIGIYPITGIIGRFVDRSAITHFLKKAVETAPGYIKIRKEHLVVELLDANDAVTCFNELNGKHFKYPRTAKKNGKTGKMRVRIEIYKPYHGESRWIEMSPLIPTLTEEVIFDHMHIQFDIPPRSIWLRPGNDLNDHQNGWALVECASPQVAERTVSTLNDREYSGISLNRKCLKVESVIQREVCRFMELEGNTQWVIFHRLHRMMTRDDLSTICSKFGTVRKCFKMWSGSAPIFGVEMLTVEGAKAVFHKFEGKKVTHLTMHTQYADESHPLYSGRFASAPIEMRPQMESKKKTKEGTKRSTKKRVKPVAAGNLKRLPRAKKGKKDSKKSRVEKKLKNAWSWAKKGGIKTF